MACILLSDDQESVRLALDFYLVTLGHAVVAAEDGGQGLQLAAERPFDLVLLDVDMPGFGGLAVCEALQSDPKLRHLPVVMMSGRATPEMAERVMVAGARALLRKPFDLEDLRATVERHGGRR
jgi:CheY-like chemotaxis protein